MLHPAEHGWVHEVPQYDTEGLGFLALALGAAFIILLLMKHWRDHDY